MVDKKEQPRNDGFATRNLEAFVNRQTGYNTGCDGINNNFDLQYFVPLTCSQLTVIYRTNKLIEKIIDLLPEESGLIPGQVTDSSGVLDAEVLEAYETKLTQLNATQNFIEADKLSRLYSDAYIIMGIDDGGDLETPVNEDNIREITWLRTRDRNELTPELTGTGREPEFYRYSPSRVGAVDPIFEDEIDEELERFQLIHKSRVICMAGKKLPRQAFFYNAGYNDSIVQTLLNGVLNYYQSIAASNALLNRSGLFVYKMFGLEDYARTQNSEALQSRFEFINLGVSVFKSLFIDAKKGEEADFVTQNFAGVDKILTALQDHMISLSGYPRSVILGSSNSTAFSEGGESDRFTMAQLTHKNQMFKWLPGYERLLNYLMLSGELPDIPEDTKLTMFFPSTLELTPKEQAELEKLYAESDQIRINSRILMEDEVRESRYGQAEFSTNITIDPEVNIAELKAQEQEKERSFQKEMVAQKQPPSNNNFGN